MAKGTWIGPTDGWLDGVAPRRRQPPPSRPIKRTPPEPEKPPEKAVIIEKGRCFHCRPVPCPRCKAEATRVTSTQLPIRYHKCNACGYTFQSIEQ